MSALGDALSALRKVVLIEDNVSRLQTDVASLAEEIRRVRDYAGTVDRRVAVIEGTLNGFAMARGLPPLLPKE